jgi:hypothetical protein
MVSMGPLQMCGGAIGDCQQLDDAGPALKALYFGEPFAQRLCHHASHALASRLSNSSGKPVRFWIFDIDTHRAPLQKILLSSTIPYGRSINA